MRNFLEHHVRSTSSPLLVMVVFRDERDVVFFVLVVVVVTVQCLTRLCTADAAQHTTSS